MRSEIVIRHLGKILLLNALFMFISALISFGYKEDAGIILMYSGLLCSIFGVFPLIFVPESSDLHFKEGVLIVVIGWLLTCVVGMLPYLLWGGEFTLANAFFESVSGFTTTGSTVLSNIEGLPYGILFWRSSTHWLGGIGIILFVLLVLPQSKTPRIVILNTEMSELSKNNLQYQARKVLSILVVIYVGLTILEIIALRIAGMGFFDAINHAFATIATGGFSTRNNSIAYYNSVTIEVIIMVFMVLSGIHFGLIFGTFTGKKVNLFKSEIARAFLIVLVLGISAVTYKLWKNDMYSFPEALRYASFQVISLGSTTGFATVDTAHWPAFTKLILIYFTIQCAMVGSTSGGMKFDRVYVFFKALIRQVKLLQHPRGVIPLKIENNHVNEGLVSQVVVFIVTYLLIIFVSTTLLTFLDIDILTAFSATVATIGNVGPGFENVSSLGNFNSLPDLAKYILSLDMFLGRLEIFNIFLLFSIRKV